MKIKVYVNKKTTEIIDAKTFEMLVEEKANKLFNDNEEFEYWLKDHYTIIEIFRMNEDEKRFAYKIFREQCETYSKYFLEDEKYWQQRIIEV